MPLQLDSLDTISAYRKVRLRSDLIYAGDIKKMIVEVFAGSLSLASLEVDMVEVTGSVFRFRGAIDVQSIIQDYLNPDPSNTSPTRTLGEIGLQYKAVAHDLVTEVSFEVTYLEQLSSGKLQDIGITETIGSYDVFAATVQHLEDIEFTPYNPIFGATSLFLTNSPRTLEICETESYYLSAFSSSIGFATNQKARVQTFDSSGVLLDEALVNYLPLLTGVTQDVIVFGCGFANLAVTSWDEGSINMADPDLAYYEVTLGTQSLATFVVSSEVFTFNVVPCCDSYKVRFYFMNNKTGFDAKNLKYTESAIAKTSSTVQRPLYWADASPYHSALYRGKFPINIQSNQSYTLEYTLKSKEEGVWLQDLVNSPEVYAKIDGAELQPVIVLDASPISDLKDDLGVFQITIQPSNGVVTMRN